MFKKDEDGTICGFVHKPCIQRKCVHWIKLRGKHPQGGEIDEWGCALSWLPILLIESTQNAIHTTAALNSFRNAMVRQNNEFLKLEKRANGDESL